jgi:hypothetical protein
MTFLYDRMRIVEMEATLKMVCIGRYYEGDQQQRAAQPDDTFVAQRSGYPFKHQIILLNSHSPPKC